jgi:hypothetical protein
MARLCDLLDRDVSLINDKVDLVASTKSPLAKRS